MATSGQSPRVAQEPSTIMSRLTYLWVKWVNQIYLKGRDWLEYSPTNNSSWSWRKVCKIKELLQSQFIQQVWREEKGHEYTIARGYEFLRSKGEPVSWAKLVWHKYTIPKHGFIGWIYQLGRLNTNDKLYRLGISEENNCYLCGRVGETIEHLFFDCDYKDDIDL
ncbi:uncharacterized protein LOC141617407 [Silene latifolia]|uniref:uncharacterized protein LOC141617407 n=1 Tax=Silene latifolia TaxID=37657 RepID=UPI003D77B81B